MIPVALRGGMAAVNAELLDLSTAHPARELNGVVLALGTAAPFAKLGLIAFLLTAAFLVGRTRYRVVGGLVLGFAVVVGGVGALSNVVAA